MGYIHTINIGANDAHLIEPALYATAGGTSTALTAGINNFALFPGAYVNIKVGNVGANATLNVNNTGAIDIYYNNVQINSDTLTENNIYTFIYDGAHWTIVGDITAKNILIGTSAEWDQHSLYRPQTGTICIYTDHGYYMNNSTTVTVPGIKISDGLAYIGDQPFVGDDVAAAIRIELNDHINDNIRHITAQERNAWNNKLNCAVIGENLQLNTQNFIWNTET